MYLSFHACRLTTSGLFCDTLHAAAMSYYHGNLVEKDAIPVDSLASDAKVDVVDVKVW